METLLPLAAQVAALLKRRGETVAVAESSAGGLLSAALLSVPGASAYFLGGVVVYTRQARRLLMEDAAMTGMRSSSEPYAQFLARTMRARLGADWGLAETGASGPAGNSYGDAPGHSCLAVAGAGALEQVTTIETGLTDRTANMRLFTQAGLKLFAEILAR